MLADSSHRVSIFTNLTYQVHRNYQCIMITGDNPLTAAHVARDVEIVDRDVLVLDLRENPKHDAGMKLPPK